ncbi:Nif11-like leader peptide family natural product precursor [Iodidimonas sp. SYSU 1G8]|uniref:Nif11-like leader peptide family natural product precursor n=1 Tax=Iodidimonas sp. SYSU 1G8 TaxID=3133967 RepID=UPI0031FF3430
MSVENAERFIRFMKDDESLQQKIKAAGPEQFEQVSAEAGASCTAYDFVCAVVDGLKK